MFRETIGVARRSAPEYRPDLDGLRAIAVVSVVLFHAKVPGFEGGYVGVDVFFVVSGFLITRLILGDVDKPLSTWLAEFYVRRGRRILPALFATCLITAIAVIVLYLPWDIAPFGKSLAATPLMAVNIVEWLQPYGYFKSGSAHMPIAHFWSIAVEEQFYLLYPIVITLITRRYPRNRRMALFAVAVVSFAASLWGSYFAVSANYFLAPTRAWELLLGAILAEDGVRRVESAFTNELLACLASLTLAYAVLRYDNATPYPGAYAVAPCAATAALIWTSRSCSTIIGKLLSRKSLIFTGLISYSLYLWHYPLLTIVAYFQIERISAFELPILLAATYLISVASWRYIEIPIRNKTLLRTKRSFLLWMGAAAAVILTLGMILYRTGGLPWRYPTEFHAREFAILANNSFEARCVALSPERISEGRLCSYGPQDDSAVRGLVWGDSHAMALLPAYRKLAAEHHMRLYFAMTSSCRPLLGVRNRSQSVAQQLECGKFNDAVRVAIQRLNPSLLILNAHWIDADADLQPSAATDTADAVLTHGPAQSNFKRALLDTLRATAAPNRAVCIILDVPKFAYDMPYAVAMARKRGISEDFLKQRRTEALQLFHGPETDIHELASQGLLRSVDPKEVLCSKDFCSYEVGGKMLYRDADHVTPVAAEMIASTIAGCY